MINHRNGPQHHNVDRHSATGGLLSVEDEYTVAATQRIPAGQQLHNSYNQCQYDKTCYGIDKSYVTPQIFLDYGFVEQYPRRFAFDVTGLALHDEDDDDEFDDDEFDEDEEDNTILVWEVQE